MGKEVTYSLPTSLTVNGTEYAIESDFRRVLDIMELYADPELDENEKAILMLEGLYTDFAEMPYSDYQEACIQASWFIDGGVEETAEKGPKLMDWSKDFRYIVAPVNRVMGEDVRGMKYCHWWTFLAAWQEIGGDCMFAQIVNIRSKKARGKKLDDSEKEFYRRNRKAIDFEKVYSEEENALLAEWT